MSIQSALNEFISLCWAMGGCGV